MILQALYDYYQRKALDPDPTRRLPAYGLEDKEIPFIIELSADGRPLGIVDTRQIEGKKKVARRYLVPKGVKRSSGVAANLLWDTAEYVLGVDTRGKPERVAEQHAAFRQRIADLPESVRQDAGIQALELFYTSGGTAQLSDDACWPEILEVNPVMTFRLHNDGDLICQRPAVVSACRTDEDAGAATAVCLVTGEPAATERLHTVIKGVWGAQSSGATLVSFNLDAFASFNKEQGDNATVSPFAAFAYTTALNHLLDRNSRQRFQVGDASTVFWAQKPDEDAESAFSAVFWDSNYDDPDAQTELIRGLLNSVYSGQFDGGRGDNRFFVLGLAPNAARISVRFWYAEPIRVVAEKIREWFEDLEISRPDYEPPYPALRRLLGSLCIATKEKPFGDIEKLPEIVSGDVTRALLSGGLIPAVVLNAALQRCRAEQAKKDPVSGKPVRHVPTTRAALIKAYLNRYFRLHAPDRKEITVSLDRTNKEPAYLRGRLFALYERIQELAAERELNRTIRDAFFGSAMATPRAVFPRLIRLDQVHMRDLRRRKPSVASYFDRELREVNDGLPASQLAFPASCPSMEQGLFTLGYYHQRQDFFNKSTQSDESTQGDSK